MNSSGCDSLLSIQLTILQSTADTLVDSVCFSYLSPSGNATWTTSGMYMDTLTNAAGCDSLLTLDLTITNPDTAITQNAATLTATATTGTFQWVDCDNNFAPLAGETNAAFTATANGNYAVIVTKNGCADTSGCVSVLLDSRQEMNALGKLTAVPNPHSGLFSIPFPASHEAVIVRIFDSAGREVLQQEFSGTARLDLAVPGANGMYWVYVRMGDQMGVVRVVKSDMN